MKRMGWGSNRAQTKGFQSIAEELAAGMLTRNGNA